LSIFSFVEIWFTILTKSIIISRTVFNVCETSSRVFFLVIIRFTVITKSINVIKAVVNISKTLIIIVSLVILWITLITNIVNLRGTEADLIITSWSISCRKLCRITSQTNCSFLQLAWRNANSVLDAWLLVISSSISRNTKFTIRIKMILTVSNILNTCQSIARSMIPSATKCACTVFMSITVWYISNTALTIVWRVVSVKTFRTFQVDFSLALYDTCVVSVWNTGF
jgi:hypothetical protein